MTRDRLLMIYSVLLALAMWGFVMVRGQSMVTLDVPLSFQDVPVNLSITDGSKMKVRVSVSGHDRFLEGLGVDDVKVRVSLKGLKRGEHLHALKRTDITLPAALKVTGLSPSVLHLRLQRTATKTIPVRAVVTGLPAEGFSVSKIQVTPQQVKVKGLRSELRSIEMLDTDPVDISSAAMDVEAVVSLNLSGRDVAASEGDVKVVVIIKRESE